jgi:hypothetical protein
MALTVDPATKVWLVLQADLAFVSGALYDMDTDQIKQDMMTVLSSEDYIWMDDSFIHNTEVTVAGTTFARTIEIINSHSITLEDTMLAYSVRMINSNNNMFDVENLILNPTGLVTVISTNSAGLITTVSGSGVTPGDVSDIADAVWDEALADHTTPATYGLDTTSAEHADAVWDETASEHTTPGTFGDFVQNKLLTVAKWIGLK